MKITRREAIISGGCIAGITALESIGLTSTKAAEPKNETPKTKFSFCLNTGTIRGQKLGLVKEIELAAKAGYQGIEPWVSSIEEYAKSGGSLKDLNKRIHDLGIQVESAIGFSEWIVSDDNRRSRGMERIQREMDMIAQIGGKRLAAPPAGETNVPGLDLLKAAERYRALLNLGDQMGVIPQLELWGFSKNLHLLGETMFVAIESGHLKACVLPDIFHIYKGGSNFSGLRFFGKGLIQVFHMNDYPSDPPKDKINDSYRVMPGDGVAPVSQILQDLSLTGEPIVLSLELFNKSYWEQDPLKVMQIGLEKMKVCVQKAFA